jgi:MFS family permease
MPVENSFFARNWRWFVLGTLFLATFLNYLDRQTLSNAADPICAEFNLDNAQRGELLAIFVYYLRRRPPVRRPAHRPRHQLPPLVFPVFVLGWSLCNLLVAFARDYSTLLWLRAALGVFEAGNFPICLLLIARIFPARERVLANGIFYSGGVIATLVAPKFVIYVASQHHWRWAFLVTGGLGFLWLVPWLLIFRHPEQRAPGWAAADHGRHRRHRQRGRRSPAPRLLGRRPRRHGHHSRALLHDPVAAELPHAGVAGSLQSGARRSARAHLALPGSRHVDRRRGGDGARRTAAGRFSARGAS